MRAYIAETGPVLWAWNEFHSMLQVLFTQLVQSGSWDVSAAIWHSAATDSNQRQLLLATAEARLESKNRMLARIRWVVKIADKLAEYRNLAAQLPMTVQGDAFGESEPVLMPDRLTTKRSKALKAIIIYFRRRKFWQVLAGDIYVLDQYVHLLCLEFLHPNERLPSPHKPRLHILPTVREIDAEMSRLTLKPARKRRKRAPRRKS